MHWGLGAYWPLCWVLQIVLRERLSGRLLLAASTHLKAKEGPANEAVRESQVRRHAFGLPCCVMVAICIVISTLAGAWSWRAVCW